MSIKVCLELRLGKLQDIEIILGCNINWRLVQDPEVVQVIFFYIASTILMLMNTRNIHKNRMKCENGSCTQL